jgi:peptidyl-prolyl cis-trans isomerase A (cyclophilin A)
MRTLIIGTVAAALAAGMGAFGAEGLPGQAGASAVIVSIVTERGVIEIEVDLERAPVTSENFLRYVDAGRYDGGVFHRTVRPDTESRTDYPIEVVQARGARGRGRGQGRGGFAPIPLEPTNVTGLLHLDGVVSMARSTRDSATHEFFVCIGDQPELDFGGRRNPDGQGFAAFGRVVSGMDLIRKIQASPIREGTQTLDPSIVITRAVRKTREPRAAGSAGPKH